ncbi:MAG: FHA domain-containing protein [Actinomycetota bacterium]
MTNQPYSQPTQSIIVWVDGQAFHGLHGHTIGREASESITVDHAQVSRRHAILSFEGGSWSLRDLGSTNGLHDGTSRLDVVLLPPGRTPVWLGPPDTSPCVYFDVTMPGGGGGGAGGGGYGPQGFSPLDAGVPGAPGADPSALDGLGSPSPGPGSLPTPGAGLGPSAHAPGPAAAQAPPPGPIPQPSGTAAGTGVGGASPQAPPAVSYTPPQNSLAGAGPLPPPQASPSEAAPPALNNVALTTNIGQLSQVIDIAQSELVIGRSTECDLTIADPLVSRRHARLVITAGVGNIEDLGSDNGTFVNGERITSSPVVEGDLIEMGKAQFILSEGRLQQHVAHGLPLQADGLTVTVGGDLRILSDVSFTLPAGSMTAVIGPSGSGKSTLLNALTGRRPADEGRVLLGGRDLYASDEGLGRRIGFVPQDDPVHLTLYVKHALMAAAQLRLPADASKAEITANVEQVAAELGLSERLDTRVQALSGGQRKRVSVGYELVGAPQALILDEPTSGLDPGMERDLMANLRQLADKGTTSIVVTHSVQSVELCDLVLVLAPGGRLAFIGPPDKVAGHFKCPDLASVFTLLGTRQKAEWELEFAKTTSYLKFGAPAPTTASAPSTPLPARSFTHDFRVMLVRYVRALVGDKRRLILLLAQAPVLGALLAVVLFRDAFSPLPNQGARQYLLATVLAMTLLGGFNAVREIVQDRDVFRRELAAGVSAFAFVLARWVVLSVITVLHAVVLHLVASLRQRDPLGEGVLIGWGHLEFLLALSAIGVGSVGVGLLISASASDSARALTALVMLIIPMLFLSGLVVPTSGQAGIEQATYLNPVQWGGSAGAVTIDLQNASGCNAPGAGQGAGALARACDNSRWNPTTSTQALNLGMAWGMAILLLILTGATTGWTLRRPLRRG